MNETVSLAYAVVRGDPPEVYAAEDPDTLHRVLALEVVAATPGATLSVGRREAIRGALLEERWGDAVVDWMEVTNSVIDVYEGPVEAITATAGMGDGQTANLAWPADHAWCVASEIDLAWSYVGGSHALVEHLLGDEQIEALPAGADDALTRVEPFVADLVEGAVEDLLATGHTIITTSMGTVQAWLERPTRWRPGAIRVRCEHADGASSGSGPLHHKQDLRLEAELRLTSSVVGLVDG